MARPHRPREPQLDFGQGGAPLRDLGRPASSPYLEGAPSPTDQIARRPERLPIRPPPLGLQKSERRRHDEQRYNAAGAPSASVRHKSPSRGLNTLRLGQAEAWPRFSGAPAGSKEPQGQDF